MIIGYARVSTQDQNLDLQLDALKKAACEQIFQEKVSGAKKARPELEKMLNILRKGDVVVVYKLDRMGRSLAHLLELIQKFSEMGVEFISISDKIDTGTAVGRFVFHISACFAQLERDLIRERTHAGLAAAKERGRVGGRPKGLKQEALNKALAAKALYEDEKLSVAEIIKQLNISKQTLYNYLKYLDVPIRPYKTEKD